MENKLAWKDFYKEFTNNKYIYDISYKNNVYTIGSEYKHHKLVWFFCTQHAYDIKPFYQQFESPQELLNNALIDGNHLENIWDDIIIN